MNLDMGIVAALTAACSVFGLPWLVAATVRSLAHVKSLTKYEQLGWGKERIAGVAEQRYVQRQFFGSIQSRRSKWDRLIATEFIHVFLWSQA